MPPEMLSNGRVTVDNSGQPWSRRPAPREGTTPEQKRKEINTRQFRHTGRAFQLGRCAWFLVSGMGECLDPTSEVHLLVTHLPLAISSTRGVMG